MKRILVVCLGNICRSPIGEGLLKYHATKNDLQIHVESAGTSGWHQGEKADPRSIEVMRGHGHNITNQRSRVLVASDLHTFDYILVMDSQNLIDVNGIGAGTARVERFVNGQDVPDPYHGGANGFEQVYSMIDDAARKWVKTWSKT
ncbi:MAG: protein-tyrosine-phosphatase [Crocinitomicaceae bacterium]|nr:protein-tyrosine-phosphatase [Crocinitomicaceae bacterium]